MRCSLLNFGEINEPSSRAFWAGFDDEEFDNYGIDLQLNYHVEEEDITKEQFDTLLVIEGHNIKSFAESTLLTNSKLICDTSRNNLSVYRDGKNLVAVVRRNLEISGQLLELLLPFAKISKNVITLTINSKIDYKSENYDELDKVAFVRGINSKIKAVKELHAPNFISGVAAGISSWSDIMNLSYEAYIAYIDNELDELNSKPILEILQKLGINCLPNYVPKHTNESNLYM